MESRQQPMERHRKALPEIWVYEMCYDRELYEAPDIACEPLTGARFEEYMELYNECFYPMRKALDIKPYRWYSEKSQLAGRAQGIHLLIEDNRILGAVACYGNEIDDLIVRPSERGRGYGRRLLLWAMVHIRSKGNRKIVLRVAEWNHAARDLYKRMGFVDKMRKQVR